MALVDPSCFPGLSPAEQQAQLFEALSIAAAGGAGPLGTEADPIFAVDRLKTAEDVITVASSGLSASATFTPAAASHVAGDCNGAAAEFALGAPTGSQFLITSAQLVIASATAEVTAWFLYLFSVTPPSAVADDAPHTLPSGDRASYLGKISLGTAVDEVDTQAIDTDAINKQIKLSGTSVFAYLVNGTTLTPAAVAHTVTLHGVPI